MRLLALIAVLFLALAPVSAQGPPSETHFWLRRWPDRLVKFDPVTDKVVAEVQNKHGIAHGTQLSHSKKSIFQITGQRSFVEIIDVDKAEVVEEHPFEEEGFIIRVQRIMEIPGGTHWYVRIEKVEKKLDHFVIAKPEWLHYDIDGRKILKRMKELPKAIRSGARISPDGKDWHVFGGDFIVLDSESLEEKGKIELSKPLYSGLGAIRLRGDDLFRGQNMTAYRMLYTMRDPVKTNRTLHGLLDVDLDLMQITNRRELGASPGVRRLHVTRDGKTAIAQKSSGRRDQTRGEDPVATLYTMDLETGRKVRETRVDVRNGLSLSAISPDGSKIYMSGRGHELVVYSAEHEYVKTIELEGELDGRILVVGD